MFCSKCGNQIENEVNFCSSCGSKIYKEFSKKDNDSTKKTNFALKIIVILMSVVIFVMGVCLTINIISDKSSGTDNLNILDENVEIALTKLTQHWKETFSDEQINTDGHLEITNTRVVKIDFNGNEKFAALFEDDGEIEYIVEFDLYTDYFGTAPYYQNIKYDDTVVIYKDGSAEVMRNPLRYYSDNTYSYDYSQIIVNIDNYGGSFNQVFYLK